MKLKGDLDSIGLSELFQTLSDQKATGVLSITSSMGEKHISIQQGTVSVFSDKLSERSRMGDLLVARGHLTESQLAEALKMQRTSEVRTRLGDLLVKKGVLGEDKINEVMKFQLEEEVVDLFTWKNAAFEFDSDKSPEQVAADRPDANKHHLAIDPQALIAETARQTADWKEIQNRLPTPYLCFKISPKGEEMMPRATRSVQVVVKLLKEGRTIETTVKRSCLGRINVCKGIIKLLDDGWIFPYPTSELRMLASEHRAQKRYSDALNIYRRLLESTEAENEREQLQQLVDDTIESILRAKDAGESPEGAEVVSHKKAAEDYMRRQRIRRIALAIFSVGSLAGAVVLLLQQYAPKAEMPQNYLNAIKASDLALAENRYEDAIEIWDKFYLTFPDKTTDTAQRVHERMKAIPKKFDSYVETQLQPVEHLEKADKLDEAEVGYKQLQAQFPRSPLVSRMTDGLARIREKREQKQREKELAELRAKLKESQDLFAKKQFTEARTNFKELASTAAVGTPERKEADDVLKQLDEIEKKSKQLLADALGELAAKKGEKSVQTFGLACAEWPDLPSSLEAKKEHERLKTRLSDLQKEVARAKVSEEQGDILEALDILQRVHKEYTEFELITTLPPKINTLAGQVAAVDKQLEKAKKTLDSKDLNRARQEYADILRHHSVFMSRRKLEVPVSINSNPPALLKIDGKEFGNTPQELMLPVYKPLVLTFERPGYLTHTLKFTRLYHTDLTIDARLKREPLAIQQFKGGIFAPPRIINDVVYVLHGTSLTAMDVDGKTRRWAVDGLCDDTVQTRPNPNGAGPNEMVPDKAWWSTRIAAEPFSAESIVLTLRSREIVELNTKTRARKTLVTLPTEPVGAPGVERASLLAGKTLLAAGASDGKVRLFDLTTPDSPRWELPGDPATPAPKGTLACGIAVRPNSTFVSITLTGRLAWFSMLDGKEVAALDLKSPLAAGNFITPGENVAALVHTSGNVSVVDLSMRDKLYDLPVQRATEEAFSTAVDSTGIYVMSREGVLKKFPRDRQRGVPSAIWQKPLDGAPERPLTPGPKAIYAVSSEGTVYALAIEDGRELWNFRPDKKPAHITLYKDYLYLASEDGTLIIMSAE